VVNTGKTSRSVGVFGILLATPLSVRYLLGGVLINQAGAFVQTFLVLYLTIRGFSVGSAGIALTVYSAGSVCGTLLGAELTNRLGPRLTITGAMTVSAVFVGLVPVLSRPSLFGVLLVAMAVAGLATQSYRPAAAVLLSDLMPAEHRVMAFSMMRIALNIGAAVGPLVAAWLILIDWNLLFLIDAATALAYSALSLVLLPSTPPALDDDTESAADKRSAYSAMLHDGAYLLFLASALLASAIYVQYTVALPLKIVADGHSPALYSAVLTSAAVVLVLCELKITTYVRRWRPAVAAAGGTALMAVGIAGYAVPDRSDVVIIVATVVFVFGVMISGPTVFAYPATFPAAVRARYIGAQQAVFGLGLAIGPTLGVLAWRGLGNGIWPVCGGVGVVAALCALVGMRDKAIPSGSGSDRSPSDVSENIT